VRHEVYVARAYALQGVTADGSRVERGIVAADTRVLPLGSRIRVTGAGAYSGEYVVRDTGRLVIGRKLDVYVPTYSEARKFGRKVVKVQVISWGKTRAAPPRTSAIAH
jgi:3D (Asp-Asp-Asp) domain-containing protein